MLKLVLASALAGAVGLFAGYRLYVAWSFAGTYAPPAVIDLGKARSELGRVESVGPPLRLTLDQNGRGVVLVPVPSLRASEYAIVHLQFDKPPAAHPLWLMWRTDQFGQRMADYKLNSGLAESLWVPLDSLAQWSGSLLELAILIQGNPGEVVRLDKIELLPGSPDNRLRAFYSGWTSLMPWNLESINKHLGTRFSTGGLQPAPLLFLLFLCSGLAYWLLLLVLQRSKQFDLRISAGLFLLCWLMLDLVWQGKLVQQLSATHGQFAGKTSEQKLLAGPDAPLVRFIRQISERIDSSRGRVFVVSSADFQGMRAAYYLYPLNVFWDRRKETLPPSQYLASGDYVVTVNPTVLQFDARANTLRSPDGDAIPVELLASDGLGHLFRVM